MQRCDPCVADAYARYQELHNKISSRSFNSRVAQALSTVKEVVEEKTCLNVVGVVKGGSVGKGTAITDCEDAELVFFVKGLPTEGHAKWLPPLLQCVPAGLRDAALVLAGASGAMEGFTGRNTFAR